LSEQIATIQKTGEKHDVEIIIQRTSGTAGICMVGYHTNILIVQALIKDIIRTAEWHEQQRKMAEVLRKNEQEMEDYIADRVQWFFLEVR
jgi:hypothetical protein